MDQGTARPRQARPKGQTGPPKQLSYILNGTRAVRQAEAAAIAAFFGETVTLSPAPNLSQKGFAETANTFLTPIETPPTPQETPTGHSHYRVNRSEPGFGIFAGDMITLHLGVQPRDGQLAVVTEDDGFGVTETYPARIVGNYFMRADPTLPPRAAHGSKTITSMGRIVSLHRDFAIHNN